MANPPQMSFVSLWENEEVRLTLLNHIDNTALCALRLVSSECYEHTNKPLFIRTRMTFTSSALTRTSRIQALSRVGESIEHLTFAMPHASSTFLPPLINPINGKEVTFLYTPHTTIASVLARPKYGGDLIGDILTQQYPPIFHAATNVPAFNRALRCMPNLRHLTISCPGQDPAQRYRRNAVDYALTSLRIAIEHADMVNLKKLTLDIHPGGLLYLRHMPGFGSTPSAGVIWKQIRKLDITMDAWDFYGPRPGLDHLKILDDYIRSFSFNLEKIRFTWNGLKGPCPLMIYSDPLMATKKTKLFAEVTSPMSPLPAPPPRPNIKLPKLRYMQIRNAFMSAPQVANFVHQHKSTCREFDFENVALAKQGTWEEALAPLSHLKGNDKWRLPKEDARGFEESSENILASTCDNQDFARYVRENNEVIDTLEELRRQSLRPTQKVNTRKLKRNRKHHHHHHQERGTLFGELSSEPSLPDSIHPVNQPRVIPSSLFFHPHPTPPPPPQPDFLPSPTTPTPASRFPHLSPLQTAFGDSPSPDMFMPNQEPQFEVLKPSTFDPFQPLFRSDTQSSSPPRTPPDLVYSTSASTLTPTTSNTPTTPRLDSPIHFYHHHEGKFSHPLQSAPPQFFHNPSIQGNQRNLHAEASRQELTDDPAKRTSVLAKARECVLLRLGKEFGLRGAPTTSEKKAVPEASKEGFWSRFYAMARSGDVVVDREKEAVQTMEMNAAFGVNGLVVGDVSPGGRGYFDEEISTRYASRGLHVVGDQGRKKTESVPLMFSRY